ncbi:MAG: hypothetical protein GY769_22880 [bacterium]|nr:hypothetical protein [bacterium]
MKLFSDDETGLGYCMASRFLRNNRRFDTDRQAAGQGPPLASRPAGVSQSAHAIERVL